MGVYIWSRLPSAYQEVEWIQSSGTQRIDTGINVSNDTTYGYKICVSEITTQYGAKSLMDMGGTSTDDNRYGISYGGLLDNWQFGYARTSSPYWGTSVSGYGPGTRGTETHILEYNPNGNKTGVIDGTTVVSNMAMSNRSYSSNWNVFCQVYGTTFTRYGEYKLRYLKIYHGSTLVRDFVPCYRKSDSVIGLYDLVNNQFYTNSGTGTFTKGSDVDTYRESLLKNAYIGEVYEYSYDFTKGSISDLTNQGWTGLSNCSINTTYGLTSSTSWDTPLLSQPKLTSVLSSAKKIKIAYTCYKGATGNTTQRGFGFRNNGTANVWVYGDGRVIQLVVGGTQYINTTSSQSVGTYNFSLDIDLTTKKAVYSGITSGTYTITDSDIATIRTGDELRLAVSSNSYIKNVSITVE